MLKKWGDQLNRLLNKQQQIFLMIHTLAQKGYPHKKIIFSQQKNENIILLCDQPFFEEEKNP